MRNNITVEPVSHSEKNTIEIASVRIVSPCFASAYADDLKIALRIDSYEDVCTLQNAINKIQEWAVENGLEINANKTKAMSFGLRSSSRKNHGYAINNRQIEHVEAARDLGFIWHPELKMDNHANATCARARKIMAMAIPLAKTARNRTIIKTVYNVYARPIIEYVAPVWATERISHYKNLDRICHYATRWALGTPRLPIQTNYVEFPDRCKLLKMDEPFMRRNYLLACMASKIKRRELLCGGNGVLQHAVRSNITRHTRYYNVWNVSNSVWRLLMQSFNKAGFEDDPSKSWAQQQQQLKSKFLENTSQNS